ncbi:MAG: NUDIX domain-containing protein [Bacilli bacterium]|nr:NUDIX domain-containing protein [Bacilli bacterium]
METIVLNDNNLLDKDIDIFETKSRAIISVNNKILVCDYNDVCILPGGKIENGEDEVTGLRRELKEEIGIDYTNKELKPLFKLIYYQSNYPTRDGKIKNRCIKTSYYITKYKGIDLNNINRSEEELKSNFELKLMSIDELYDRMNLKNNNPRNKFFNKEMHTLLKKYENKRP